VDFRSAWSRFQADVANEAACLVGEVTAAIVGQPLDGDRQAIDRAEAMLDGSEHQITNVLAADAAGGGEETPRSQQSSAKATRTRSPLSQPISKPSEHQRRLRSAVLA
jgi:hypothetical protein